MNVEEFKGKFLGRNISYDFLEIIYQEHEKALSNEVGFELLYDVILLAAMELDKVIDKTNTRYLLDSYHEIISLWAEKINNDESDGLIMPDEVRAFNDDEREILKNMLRPGRFSAIDMFFTKSDKHIYAFGTKVGKQIQRFINKAIYYRVKRTWYSEEDVNLDRELEYLACKNIKAKLIERQKERNSKLAEAMRLIYGGHNDRR